MRWFRKSAPRPTTLRRVDRLRPFIEQLEAREVPAALVGRAYVDTNNDGVFNSGDAILAGAQVTLFSKSDLSTALATQTTDAFGIYRFTGLAAGDYRLVESAAGYTNRAVNVGNWTLGGVTAVQPNAIDVTISPTAYSVAFNTTTSTAAYGDELPAIVHLLGTSNFVTSGTRFGTFTGELNATLSGGALTASTAILTYCLNLSYAYHSGTVTPRADFVPTSTYGDEQLNRIGYLYATYGNSFNGPDPAANAINAAALQLALWELVYDLDPAADPAAAGYLANGGSGSGNFYLESIVPGAPGSLTPDAAKTAAVRTQAYSYLKESLGQSAPVVLLDGPTTSNQMFIVNGSLDFGNVKASSITGIKYNDINGDGTRQTGEDPLSGITIDLYKDLDNSGTLTPGDGPRLATTVTGANGVYTFDGLLAGTYFVKEEVPDGSTQTEPSEEYYTVTLGVGAHAVDLDFGNFQLGSISGTKFEDGNGNGVRDGGEGGLAGVTIFLDANNDGILEQDSERSTVTDADGNYSFTGLTAGTYSVREVNQTGWVQTTDNPADVTVTSGVNVGSADFGNFKTITIGGTKFLDVNGDGNRDTDSEPTVEGVTINLYRDNGDGVLTAADGGPIDWVQTGANGAFAFTGLAPGTYFVAEVAQSGYTQTAGPLYYTVNATSGNDSTLNDFGNFENATITGRKVTDQTGDGITGDDTGLGGVTINLYAGADATGPIVDTTTTAADGTYTFTDVAPGTYFVQEEVPAGSIQTVGTAGYVVTVGDNGAGSLQSGGTSTGNDFANFKTITIGGTKFEDKNGSGARDAGESGLAGWHILINGVDSAVTDADGNWTVSDLGPGSYTVQEVQQDGWTQTAGGYPFIALSGTNLTGLDFGNFKDATITGKKVTDLNGNGAIDGGDTGLGGVTINLYAGADATGPIVDTTTTAADGTYTFTDVAPGTYFVQEEVPAGSIQTVGLAGYAVTVGNGTADSVQSGAVAGGYNFANFKTITISGTKTTDLTGNGFSGDDTPLGGVTIELYKDNGDGLLTGADGAPVASTLTADNGTYSFAGLSGGTYFVKEGTLTGYVQTDGAAVYTVAATSGTDVGNQNFANFQTVTVSGTKYRDVTGNGITGDDTPLGGVTIELYKDNGDGLLTGADGAPVASTLTADNGTYSFAGLSGGTYFVKEVVPPGSTPTVGADGYKVTLTSGTDVGSLNFANYSASGTISGTKYLDVTGNGYSADDTGLGGVTIYLDVDGSKTLTAGDISTVTDASGNYSFAGLGAGTYVIREVVQDGFVRTGPVLVDNYTVTLAANGSVTAGSATGNNFTNAETCDANTVTNVSFKIVHCDGSTETVTDLRGHTREGDVITVTFKVNVPVGETHQVTFVSYTAPQPYFDANTASQQKIYDLVTGNFGPGTYSLTVHVPNCYYQVDFVCGFAIDKLGPAGSNIFYTPQGRLESADNGGSHACCDGPTGTISGYKFNDADADGTWDAGEAALSNWTIYLDANGNGVKDAGELATVTDGNGYYKFNNLAAGTYKVREVQKSGWVQSAGPAGSATLALAAGENRAGVNFGNYQGGTVTGYKFNDKNADGSWDRNGLDNCSGTGDDEVGLGGWTIFVDYNGNGQLDAGEASDVTDANGYYSITGVKAGTYQINEVMKSGWIRTTQDAYTTLTSGCSVANVNIGNFQGNLVMTGDTATIGFWNNKNGQCLINSLNGGSTSKALGNWLASNFANLYGTGCGANNLAGKTNAQVAAYFQTLFNKTGQKLEAQVLATALAVYVTNSTLAGGTYARKYGFNVSTAGVAGDYYNIGDNGAAFGVANDSAMTVMNILKATNARAVKGVLWNGNTAYRNMGNVVFTGINEQGDIK